MSRTVIKNNIQAIAHRLSLILFVLSMLGFLVACVRDSSEDNSAEASDAPPSTTSQPEPDNEAVAEPMQSDFVIEVEFIESAPKDTFAFKSNGACDVANVGVTLDLSTTSGGLIFDTTETGAGVEVFQPFEVVAGEIRQIEGAVADGDSVLNLEILKFDENNRASFTIDVDDTLVDGELGQIRVSDSEIVGGSVTFAFENDDEELLNYTFSESGSAILLLPFCP